MKHYIYEQGNKTQKLCTETTNKDWLQTLPWLIKWINLFRLIYTSFRQRNCLLIDRVQEARPGYCHAVSLLVDHLKTIDIYSYRRES